MNRKKFIPYYIYICALMAFVSCNSHPALPEAYSETDKQPVIYPDYTDVTVPYNIAPLNFMAEYAEECVAHIQWKDGSATYGDGNKVQISDNELLALHEKRARKIFASAIANGVEVLILGAFGCGAFCNDPYVVARAYKNVLPDFAHYFHTIEFAIYCRPADSINYDAFKSTILS